MVFLPNPGHWRRQRTLALLLLALASRVGAEPLSPIPPDVVEFHGVVGAGEQAIFSLTRQGADQRATSVWLGAGEAGAGLRVLVFDPATALLQVECDGRHLLLRLRAGVVETASGARSYRSPAQIAEAIARARGLRFAGVPPGASAEAGSTATAVAQKP